MRTPVEAEGVVPLSLVRIRALDHLQESKVEKKGKTKKTKLGLQTLFKI